MPNRYKIEKRREIFGKIFEPIGIGLLALLFIIPTITVMNLTPITKKLEELNVLGVSTNSDLDITLVEGNHDSFISEDLYKDEDVTTYVTKLSKLSSDSYSKPILEVVNNSTDIKTIEYYGQTLTNTNSNIYLIWNEQSFLLQDDRGFTYPQDIDVYPGETQVLFLSIESLTGVEFSEDFEMEMKVINSI
jgi:hypothetical protein